MDGCTLYATSNLYYAYLVILLSIFAVAIVYAISNFLPGSTRSKLRDFGKAELVQTILSIFIIIAVVAFSQVACSLSLVGGSGSSDPFTFAENYISSLLSAPNTGGIYLMTTIFSYSYVYTLISGVFDFFGSIISAFISGYHSLPLISPTPGYGPGAYYGTISTVMLSVLMPLTLMGVALTFIQYIALIVSQAAAFAILLPIALVLRAFAFTSKGVRNAANAALAIAIALYIIYPLTVVFDANALNWITTSCSVNPNNCNPSAVYISTPSPLYINGFFSTSATGSFGIGGQSTTFNFGSPLSSSIFPYSAPFIYLAEHATSVMYTLIVNIAGFLFKAIFMLAINLTITLSFAMGLSRALDSGVEGAANFWSSL
ncbi:MAG: hypothetical protein ACP5RI_03460 [Candidatus Micrarchaeia archaeon]